MHSHPISPPLYSSLTQFFLDFYSTSILEIIVDYKHFLREIVLTTHPFLLFNTIEFKYMKIVLLNSSEISIRIVLEENDLR